MIRLDGEIIPLPFNPLTPKDARRLIYDTLTNDQLERYETKHELDFGYSVKDLARFRFNVYMQRGSVAGALRVIPTKIPAFETLGLPHVVREMSQRTSGLILVTGPTGSGKTALLNFLCAQARKFKGRLFYFDRDRGAEIFLRADLPKHSSTLS